MNNEISIYMLRNAKTDINKIIKDETDKRGLIETLNHRHCEGVSPKQSIV